MAAGRPAAPGATGFTADWLGQRVVFADGALERLPAEAAALGAERVLLIAGVPGELPDRAAALLAAGWPAASMTCASTFPPMLPRPSRPGPAWCAPTWW